MKQLSALLLAITFISCSDNDLPDSPVIEPSQEVSQVPVYHYKIRTEPYPLAESTIFVNPAPLIVPQSAKTGATITFQLSQDADFADESTITSAPQRWCMYSPHRPLEAGTWYWRYRNDNGAWSDAISFTITGDEDIFATPAFDQFTANAPRRHPRLNCYADANIEQCRATITSHPEYKSLIARATTAMDLNTDNISALYSDYATLMNSVQWLADAYILTGDEQYAGKLSTILTAICTSPATDDVLFSENFATSAITYAYTAIYDLLYTRLSDAERRAAEEQMLRALVRFTEPNIGYQENHIFDNHFWQQNMRIMFQTAFVLFDNPQYAETVVPLLQYYYELWCTRAPATGFSRDGLWHNGVGYMSANILTLAYMPKLLSYITRFDFLSHPWYRAAGRSLCYSCPTASMGVGFGDQSERYTSTNYMYPAFADFLASETGDSYAGWYAGQNSSLVTRDYSLRLYRMTRPQSGYNTDLPDEVSGMAIYSDAGEVAMHSNITDTSNDLALAFRSSGFGSGSHTTASQNAFNLYYGGSPIFHSSGYYQNFSDAHNLMSYRHSRAHNTILINGIGQPYTTEAYGAIVRAHSGSSINYALGDASYAYCGISNDPMWVEAFAAAGITQTPDNGFGTTPLTRFRRHVCMLSGNIVVIYDELAASEPAMWDWLLHSDSPFDINSDTSTLTVKSLHSNSRVYLLTSSQASMSQTDQFAVPPTTQGEQYPNQWHFTARISDRPTAYVLAVIETKTGDDSFSDITVNDGTITIGSWSIDAEMNADASPSLSIVNKRSGAGLWYGSDPVSVNGTVYSRSYSNSTIIVDKSNGSLRAVELIDSTPANSRSTY